jgi:hypothetical protein
VGGGFEMSPLERYSFLCKVPLATEYYSLCPRIATGQNRTTAIPAATSRLPGKELLGVSSPLFHAIPSCRRRIGQTWGSHGPHLAMNTEVLFGPKKPLY